MSTPSISVVMPTYNIAGLIRQAIDSVLSQASSAAEIVVPTVLFFSGLNNIDRFFSGRSAELRR